MVLWKFALLRKRLLIFSPPPVGVVCYRGDKLNKYEPLKNVCFICIRIWDIICLCASSVYCLCCLANISIPGIGVSVPELRPFFYVNIADIPSLETELSYVACMYDHLLVMT